jgi:hypothetical protein
VPGFLIVAPPPLKGNYGGDIREDDVLFFVYEIKRATKFIIK